jgi:hypothetical protein
VRLPLQHTVKNYCARGFTQRGEFLHRILRVFLVPLGIDADQDDILDTQLAVLDLGDILEFGSKTVDAPECDSVGEV